MIQVRGEHPGRLVIGDLPLVWRVFCWAGIAGFFVFAWGWLSAPPDRLSNVLNVSPALAIAVAGLYIVVTSRIVLDAAEGQVTVSNYLVDRRIDCAAISEVAPENGLEFVLASGARVKTAAYGQSVAGNLVRYPRSRRAAERMRPLLLAARPMAEHSTAKPVTTALRVSAIATAVGLGGLLILGTVILNALRVG